MLRVAHVTRSLNRGGAEVLLREIFENKRFIEVETESSLIVLDKNKIGLIAEFDAQKIYLYNIFSFNFIWEFFKVYKFFKRGNFDVIHCHLPLAGVFVAICKILGLKAKIVYSEHSMPGFYKKVTHFLLGLLYPVFNYVIFVSEEVKLDVRRQQKAFFFRCRNGGTILNGVNIIKFNVNPELKPDNILTIGIIANFRKVKRLDRWIEIAKSLNSRHPLRFRFIVGGGGAEFPSISRLIETYKLHPVIELSGPILNTPEYFHKFDFFLMTSDWEGLPVSLLEAMASGCIPVVSNVGGIKQLDIADFGCKYDVNDIQTPVKYILNLESDPILITQRKLMARKHIEENFNLDKQLSQFISLYLNLQSH